MTEVDFVWPRCRDKKANHPSSEPPIRPLIDRATPVGCEHVTDILDLTFSYTRKVIGLCKGVPLCKDGGNRPAIVSIDFSGEMRYEKVNSMGTYPRYTECFNKFRPKSSGRSGQVGRDEVKLKVVLEKGMDGYIVAYCPALKGCVTQGRTEQEALENIKEAIELYLEADPGEIGRPAGEYKVYEVAL
jgi:predicted RNase H-like HicB family nuclease